MKFKKMNIHDIADALVERTDLGATSVAVFCFDEDGQGEILYANADGDKFLGWDMERIYYHLEDLL